MTIPLLILAVFAVAAGWFGIPDNFLGTEGIFVNFFHEYVGATIHQLIAGLHELELVAHEIITLPWSWIPLLISLVVALGGLGLGWLMYVRRPLTGDQPDPLIRSLGPIHRFLNRKWSWDELYQAAFVRPNNALANATYDLLDLGLIDGTLHLVARTVFSVGYGARRFEEVVIKGGVDWVKDRFLSLAREFRYLQTGRVQEYALVSVLIAAALAAVVLLINRGWFANIF
jgi:NADH-quinone oxidoreductase subunit L